MAGSLVWCARIPMFAVSRATPVSGRREHRISPLSSPSDAAGHAQRRVFARVTERAAPSLVGTAPDRRDGGTLLGLNMC